jgi:ANTAR domain/GAF domain
VTASTPPAPLARVAGVDAWRSRDGPHLHTAERVTDAGDRSSKLSSLLGSAGNDLPSLKRLCAGTVAHLSVSGAGVSVVTGTGARDIICSTDHVSAQIEELQVSLGEGPCVDAWTRRQPVMEPDLSHLEPGRWPGFGPAARAAGAAAVFSLPLQVGQARVGALDVYRDTPGELTDRDMTDALLLGEAVTHLLLRIEPVAAGSELGGATLGFSSEVHQAAGMIMVQLDVDISEALARLRAHAYAEERPLHEVARDVVTRRLRLERDL